MAEKLAGRHSVLLLSLSLSAASVNAHLIVLFSMFVCPLNIFVGVSGPLDVEHRILCVLPGFCGRRSVVFG